MKIEFIDKWSTRGGSTIEGIVMAIFIGVFDSTAIRNFANGSQAIYQQQEGESLPEEYRQFEKINTKHP